MHSSFQVLEFEDFFCLFSTCKFYVHVTVHRESKVERETTRCNESDVYSQIFISTCFGHHYAHLQENKTVYYRIWCSAL
jgi:hypothetical protein